MDMHSLFILFNPYWLHVELNSTALFVVSFQMDVLFY